MWLGRIPVFPLLIVISLLIGISIPGYYAWSGSTQGGFASVVGYTAALFTLMAMVPIVFYVLIPPPTGSQERNESCGFPKFQFGIYHVLGAMLLVGLAITGLKTIPLPTLIGITLAATTITGFLFVMNRDCRWRLGASVACLVLPYLWYSVASETTLISRFAGPFVNASFVPVIFIGNALEISVETTTGFWLMGCCSSLVICLSAVLATVGPRISLSFSIVLLVLSTFSSFLFHGMMLA
ncbi:MAG: hypothetical protein R3C03_10880 [Pirellulaceae bacterium]